MSMTFGAWIYKKTLGSGSFGEVILYEHKETLNQIAVKKCKVTLPSELLKRWQDEVALMTALKHPNIVKGLPVPKELEANSTDLPRLGMEHCSKGDLRKKLCEPAHVCGLPEFEILLLARHISSAIEYLHRQNIIHRDIKPENIMIQDVSGKNVYKLTDLGFAKDSKHQPATSFVGTKEYMAPELYSQEEYTSTVDFWSFGTVISELITGSRPFMLSGTPLVQWHSVIGQKSACDIGFYEDPMGKKGYCQHLPEPNQLCRPMRESFENWLQLMLRTDPKSRGGPMKDQRQLCFHWLDMILSCKIVHVRSMIDGRVMSYPTKPHDSVNDLHKTLTKETYLPVDEHILVLANGFHLNDGGALLHDIFKDQAEENVVYMFQRNFHPRTDRLFVKPKFAFVTALTQGNHTEVSENGFKVMWKQAIYYCHHLMHDAKERLAGLMAILNYNLQQNQVLKNLADDLKVHVQKISAKKDFFRESLETDIKHYALQAATGFSSEQLYDDWTLTKEEVENLAQVPQTQFEEIEKEVKETRNKVFEMQKSASKLKKVDDLNETIRKSDAIFNKFKAENKVKRREQVDCKPIQDQVTEASQQYYNHSSVIFSTLGEVLQSCVKIDSLISRITDCMEKTACADQEITDVQRHRQRNMWEMLGVALRKKKETEKKVKSQISRAQSLVSPTTSPGIGDVSQRRFSIDSQLLPIFETSLQTQSDFDLSFVGLQEDQQKSMQQIQGLDWDHLSKT